MTQTLNPVTGAPTSGLHWANCINYEPGLVKVDGKYAFTSDSLSTMFSSENAEYNSTYRKTLYNTVGKDAYANIFYNTYPGRPCIDPYSDNLIPFTLSCTPTNAISSDGKVVPNDNLHKKPVSNSSYFGVSEIEEKVSSFFKDIEVNYDLNQPDVYWPIIILTAVVGLSYGSK